MARANAARVAPLVVLTAIAVALASARLRVGHGARREPYPHAPAVRDAADAAAPPLTGPAPGADDARAAASPRMLHGDARHTHRARARGPRVATLAWAREIGGAVEAQVVASADERTLYVASLDGALTALAKDDGHVVFRVSLDDRAYATPCVLDDGTVIVGSDAGRLVAITAAGAIAWKLETGADTDTSPALDPAGRAVFAAGRHVFAVRPHGDVAWRFETKGKVFTSPAVAPDGRVVFGAQDHLAYALTPAGKLAWSVDLGADVDGSPVLSDDGAAFFGTDAGEVVRVDSAGAIAWRRSLGGFVRGALALARSGDVLAGVYGPTPRQVRLRASDGAVLGAFSVQGTGAREFGVHGGALEDADGTLYFGAQDDAVYAVARDGNLLFRFRTGGDVDAPLTLLSDGSLIVASDDGKVYLLSRP